MDRQANRKGRTEAFTSALRRHRPAVQLHVRADNGKSEPHATAGSTRAPLIPLPEGVEDYRQEVPANPSSCVRDGNDGVIVFLGDAYHHTALVRRELYRVCQKASDHLLQARGVTIESNAPIRRNVEDDVFRLGGRTRGFDRSVDDSGEIRTIPARSTGRRSS